MKVRLQIFERQVPSDVSIEFAVDLVARIPDLGTPHLLACFDVAGKNGDAIRTSDRRIYAVSRSRITVKDRVSVADKIFDTGVFQQIFGTRLIRGFGQPDASGLTPKVLLVICDCDLDLGCGGLRPSRSAAGIRA